MQEQFHVQNIKCGGCVNTIRNGLLALAGITGVEVDLPSDAVTVSGEGLSRAALAARLAELGYPERPGG